MTGPPGRRRPSRITQQDKHGGSWILPPLAPTPPNILLGKLEAMCLCHLGEHGQNSIKARLNSGPFLACSELEAQVQVAQILSE